MFTISRTRLLTGAATLALTASLGASPGFAQTSDSATMGVNAQINQLCTVSSDGDLNFGPLTANNTATTNSSFTVNCSVAGDIQVEIDDGENGDSGQRHIANNGDLIPYNLHRADDFTSAWDGQFTEGVAAGNTTFDVYGIVNGANITSATAAGDYSDTITMTVSF